MRSKCRQCGKRTTSTITVRATSEDGKTVKEDKIPYCPKCAMIIMRACVPVAESIHIETDQSVIDWSEGEGWSSEPSGSQTTSES
jgi:hypothetical protein